ncbi:hypothetical protein OAG63_00790 [Methylacidiphilales bacterium]|nr:hypothetical protein [Candidatus Methylacidiphilales bacterium]
MRPQECTADIAAGTSATQSITVVTLVITDTMDTQVTRHILPIIIVMARAVITRGTLGMGVMAAFTMVDSDGEDSATADLGMVATADTADNTPWVVCYSMESTLT